MQVRILATGMVVEGRPTVWKHGGAVLHGWELEDGSLITYDKGERLMPDADDEEGENPHGKAE